MKNTIFTGAGVAIVTPMHQDGSIHYEKLGELIEFQIANQTDCIVVCGTTGEASTFTNEEYEKIVSYTCDKVAKRVPVIAGAGSNNTAHAIELSKIAEQCGADALLQVTPYYNKTSQAGLIRHFYAIADSTNLPIVLYSVPSRTGVHIQPNTYVELAKHPNIVAVKEASGDFSLIAELIALCGDQLDIYSGNDDMIVPLMSLGAKGVISVLSNIAPKETHEICALYLDGKTQESAALQLQLIPLIKSLFSDVNPIPVKEAMNIMRMNVGECRLPLTGMSESGHEALEKQLVKFGFVK